MNPEIFFNSMPKPTSPHLPISRSPMPLASGLCVSRCPRRKTETETRKTFRLNTTLATCQDAEVSTGQKCLSKLRPEEVPAHPPHLTRCDGHWEGVLNPWLRQGEMTVICARGYERGGDRSWRQDVWRVMRQRTPGNQL